MRETERELGISSMMRFDSTTSSFLDLLLTNSSAKFKRKVSTFRSRENVQTHFLSLDICHETHDSENFVGQ